MTGSVEVHINGEPRRVKSGLSVAAALLESGSGPAFRHTEIGQAPRGMFCGMGVCFDCLVTVDGRSNVRACMTSVSEGMRIATT